MANKKNFTQATDAVADMYFKPKSIEQNVKDDEGIENPKDTQEDGNINDIKDTYTANDSKPSNKSKHYDERGKRSKRFGLLLDERLKDDLNLLSKAMGNKSVNDFIVTILIEYVECEENQIKLEQYKKILHG